MKNVIYFQFGKKFIYMSTEEITCLGLFDSTNNKTLEVIENHHVEK